MRVDASVCMRVCVCVTVRVWCVCGACVYVCACRLVCVWVNVLVPLSVPVCGSVCGAYVYVCLT